MNQREKLGNNQSVYCHKCGKSEQYADTFCRECGNYLPDVDQLVRRYAAENSPETSVNKNLAANIFTLLFSISVVFTIAFSFAGGNLSVVFVHLSVLLCFIIGGWQVTNFRNNLKLKRLLKDKKFLLESEKHYQQFPEGEFRGATISEIIAQNTSGSLKLNKPRLKP